MAAYPAELSTGIVHGRFIVAVIDSEDADQDPDVVPAKGKIVFKAAVEYVTVHTVDGPVTIVLAPVTGILDDEGYLCTPHPVTGLPMYRGVRLTSTDDPDMSVTGWTWAADYRFDPVGSTTLKLPAHSFELPSGLSRDLSDLVKVPSSPGYGLPQAEGAALRAAASAERSEAAAVDAKAAAAGAAQAAATEAAQRTAESFATLLEQRGTVSGALDLSSIDKNALVHLTLTGNVTSVALPAAPLPGRIITLVIKQDATGGRTIKLPGVALAWGASSDVVLSLAANSVDVLHVMWDGVRWVCLVAAQQVAIPTNWVVG